ncbi:MAG: enoyl-CoA hydratase/isomerase family protein, partial [Sandarakinorhabdus sp.]|nr:enoyl-CoA hydratase/isomerase family protein [Sandarakinorhabdus sp.]
RLARLGPRLTAHVQGAAIGAGAEIAAFAHHVTAAPAAWFQLPELKYGFIPGAGRTASLPPRIGRHRTAFMALSMARIPARLALEWGLVDSIRAG